MLRKVSLMTTMLAALALPVGATLLAAGAATLAPTEAVAKKILYLRDLLGISRFMLHVSVGTIPHELVLESIRLLGTEVAPLIRDA